MKKRALTLLLTLCLILTLGAPALAAASFSDVREGSWYYDNVMRMAEMKALTGYADGTFRPDGSITNGEFLTVLMKTLTGTESYPAESGHWASGVLQAAYDSGVCTGDELSAGQLDTAITRAQAAKYTANAVKKLLKEGDAYTEGLSALIADFDDVERSGCAEAVLDMYARGIITGDNQGRFNPGSNIRRSEAATIALRAYDPARRQIPFGIAASVESIYADRGVFFLSAVGEKYDVRRVTVTAVSANGIQLDMSCINTASAYQTFISRSTEMRKAYADVPAPDAVVSFQWNAAQAEGRADDYAYSDAAGQELPVVDFVFTLDLTLRDGTVLPFTYTASYCVVEYGGLL